MFVQPKLTDIKLANLVVVGRIANYRLVLDYEARRERKKLLASHPEWTPAMRKGLENQSGWLTDYARFDVLVDDVLVGKAPRRLTVAWDNSTFGEPETMPPGPYLLALRDPHAPMPPLRGPSATIFPNREPASLTVLQAPCSRAFIYESGSDEAKSVRKILTARQK